MEIDFSEQQASHITGRMRPRVFMFLSFTRETEQTACSQGQACLHCSAHLYHIHQFSQAGAFVRAVGMLCHLPEASHPAPSTYRPACTVGRVEGQGSTGAGS